MPGGHALLLLAAVTIARLAPFVGKAFNIDGPLFISAACQIQAHPADFYGFTVNWYGIDMPAFEVIKNPPVASYCLAMAASQFG